MDIINVNGISIICVKTFLYRVVIVTYDEYIIALIYSNT